MSAASSSSVREERKEVRGNSPQALEGSGTQSSTPPEQKEEKGGGVERGESSQRRSGRIRDKEQKEKERQEAADAESSRLDRILEAKERERLSSTSSHSASPIILPPPPSPSSTSLHTLAVEEEKEREGTSPAAAMDESEDGTEALPDVEMKDAGEAPAHEDEASVAHGDQAPPDQPNDEVDDDDDDDPHRQTITTVFGGVETLPPQNIMNQIKAKPATAAKTEEVYKLRERRYLNHKHVYEYESYLMYIVRFEDIHFLYSDQADKKKEKEEKLVEAICGWEGIKKRSLILRRMKVASYWSTDDEARLAVGSWDPPISVIQLGNLPVDVINDPFLLRRFMLFLHYDSGELNKSIYSKGTLAKDNTRSLRLRRMASRILQKDTIRGLEYGPEEEENRVWIQDYEKYNSTTRAFHEKDSDLHRDVLNWIDTPILVAQLDEYHPRWRAMLTAKVDEVAEKAIVSMRWEQHGEFAIASFADVDPAYFMLVIKPQCVGLPSSQWNEAVEKATERWDARVDESDMNFDSDGYEVLDSEEEEDDEKAERKKEEPLHPSKRIGLEREARSNMSTLGAYDVNRTNTGMREVDVNLNVKAVRGKTLVEAHASSVESDADEDSSEGEEEQEKEDGEEEEEEEEEEELTEEEEAMGEQGLKLLVKQLKKQIRTLTEANAALQVELRRGEE
jgi:hypothetical protein